MAGKQMPKETKQKERFESGAEIELQEHRAMVYLPEHSVSVCINATVYEDGEIHKVSKTMTMDEIRDAFRRADDGYIDDDDRFYLTEKGIAEYEALEKAGKI